MQIICLFSAVLLFGGLSCSSAQNIRATVEGPIFLNATKIVYYCNLFDIGVTTTNNFEITFLFDSAEDPSVPRFNHTSSNGRVQLDEIYIIGKMRKQLKCRVRSYPANDFSTTVETVISETFINLGVEPDFVRSLRDAASSITCKACVYESDKDPLTVDFTTTVPFRCANGSFNCDVKVNYTTSPNVVLKKDTPTSNPCETVLKPSPVDGKAQGKLEITAVKDDFNSPLPRPNFVKMNFPYFPDIQFNGTTHKDNWNDFEFQFDVKHYDERREYCTVSGYSLVKTFDGYKYQMPGIGQFKFVDTTEGTPFDVHLRQWPCAHDSNHSCVCGVAVQESGIDVVVDMCVDGTPHFISRKCLFFPTDDGIRVIANEQKNRFAIIFPSGNSIYGSIVGRQMSIDIYVTPDKSGFITGLCGSYDGVSSNDAAVVADHTQWRLGTGQSIFDGKLKPLLASTDPKITQSSEDEFCSCADGVSTCSTSMASFSSIDQFNYGMDQNVQPKVPGHFTTCTFRRDDSYFYNYYKYYSWSDAAYALSWPTDSGISEAEAESYCRKYLWDDSPLKSHCAAVTNVDPFINNCKTVIQISGFLESAVDIEPELGRYCMFEGAATATVEGLSGLGNLQNLSNAYCESFSCSYNGVCNGGTCACTGLFVNIYSKDCSYNGTGAALDYSGPLCDFRTQQCDHLMLSSERIGSIFPMCDFKLKEAFFNPLLKFTLDSIKQQGSVVVENKTMCYTPMDYKDYIIAPADRALGASMFGTPILFDLSAYNAKSQSSGPVAALLYDSYCYDCFTNLTCVKKIITDGCLINGYCYRNTTIKPADSTLWCNLNLSNNSWSLVPIPTTTPAASTTVNTATTIKATAKVTTVAAVTTAPSVTNAATTTVTVGTAIVAVITKATNAPNALTTIKTTLTEDEELDNMLGQFLQRQKPNSGDPGSVSNVSQAILEKLKSRPECKGFEKKMLASPLEPVSSLSVKDNFKLLALKYCDFAGNVKPLDDFAEELENLTEPIFVVTTVITTTTTSIPTKPNLQSDLADWLKDSGSDVSPDAILDLMNKNTDCVDSEVIANIRDPPNYDKSASVEKNVYDLVALYCRNNSQLADSITDLIKTSPTTDNPSLGAILGGVIGGLSALALLTLFCCICGPQLFSVCCPFLCGCCYCPRRCVPGPQPCVAAPQPCAPVCQPPTTPGHCTTNVTTIIAGGDNFRPFSSKDYCGVANSGSTRYKKPHTYLKPNYGCREGGC